MFLQSVRPRLKKLNLPRTGDGKLSLLRCRKTPIFPILPSSTAEVTGSA